MVSPGRYSIPSFRKLTAPVIAHETGHDTERTDVDLQFPVDNLGLEDPDEEAATLGLDLRPADHLVVLVVRPKELLRDGRVVLDVQAGLVPERTEVGGVTALRVQLHALIRFML